mmetsp:Transcript_43634/g.102917  ORF Transcript_43634/g.102917 Transcript_43634/m.102917 type:complete len:81 (-) Transcript_43634:1274-1516(-)
MLWSCALRCSCTGNFDTRPAAEAPGSSTQGSRVPSLHDASAADVLQQLGNCWSPEPPFSSTLQTEESWGSFNAPAEFGVQ